MPRRRMQKVMPKIDPADYGPFQCLYKCDDGTPRTFKTEYHLVPRSDCRVNIVLPPGFVCDQCNTFFSKLENHFVHHRPGSSNRLFALQSTKRGNTPQLQTTNGKAGREDNGSTCTFNLPLDTIEYEPLPNGDIRLLCKYKQKRFNSLKVSRLLAKIAIETLIHDGEESEYWPYRQEFDHLRNYARRGPSNLKMIWFAWRGIPLNMTGEGDRRQWLPGRIPLIDRKTGQTTGSLCVVRFPGVAFAIPVSKYLVESRPPAIPEWNVVAERDEFDSPVNTVDVTLVRKTEEPNVSAPT